MVPDLSTAPLLRALPRLAAPLLALALSACSITPPPVPAEAAEPLAQWDHEWARGAVFYEVFVRSFQDSNGDGIWLMPVFSSPSYHGYDTVDYETIEPDYGTTEDFQRLLDEAHRRGIRV